MGEQIDDEIPLLLMSIYLFRCIESCPCSALVSGFKLLGLPGA